MDAMERGSEQLLTIWKERRGVTDEDVMALAEGLDGIGLETAVARDGIVSVQGRVAIDDCGNAVNNLLGKLRTRSPVPIVIEVFPLGTPVPTEAVLRVGMGEQATAY